MSLVIVPKLTKMSFFTESEAQCGLKKRKIWMNEETCEMHSNFHKSSMMKVVHIALRFLKQRLIISLLFSSIVHLYKHFTACSYEKPTIADYMS